ncbi:MAG: hypothetical protein LH616_04575, partial [Ilumatobacteraceae bacterium]|nr:hypothetical protein [Ilumatobacteraceae bacterium]
RELVDLGPIMRFAVPTTTPMRMLIDLGAVDPAAVQPAMMSILAARSASPIAIRAAFLPSATNRDQNVHELAGDSTNLDQM